MHIFLDESGNFTGIGDGTHPSAVGALVVPNYALKDVLREYTTIRKNLPQENGHVKGRSLSEPQVASVIELLTSLPVLFEATVIDVGLHSVEGLELHRTDQASAFDKNRRIAVHVSMQRDLKQLQERLEALPLQLYVQSVLTFELVHSVINNASLYFAQRKPEELSIFNWVIDAKQFSKPITPWEDWWLTVIPAMLQSKSARKPFKKLEGADYSHFARSETEWQERGFPGQETPKDGKAIDIKKILSESYHYNQNLLHH